ncbi:MAG: biotin/lipoyl-binding protein, partial [Rhizobiaceae bacterium]|nr:biotin/lipoyl-binding protein [Rhizobiaceae bacterium]
LAKAVEYQSAGTVEFIVDKDRNFYFLEMNTRLQVEHPVTELITGIDLVEEMLRVASGEPLRVGQDEIRLDGWAVESRLYAEDPFRSFLPSIGRLTRYRPPAEGALGTATVRNDTGVAEGSEISMFYDPMIAKLCTHAATREAAVEAMGEALGRFEIEGIEHNIPFLSALMRHPRWRAGRLSTAFIAEEYPEGFQRPEPSPEVKRRAALIATGIEIARRRRLDRHVDRLRPHGGRISERWEAKIDGDYVGVLVEGFGEEDGALRLDMSEGGIAATLRSSHRPGEARWSGTIDGAPAFAQIRARGTAISLFLDGLWIETRVMSPETAALYRLMLVKTPPDTSMLLLCPMPGLVVSIAVVEGQEVKAGETLAVVEAMKMENVLRAERDLTVSKVLAQAGSNLAVDAVIMEFA